MANPMKNVVIGSGLVAANYLLFVPRQRYVPIVREHWREKRRVTALAIALHAVALSLFFIPAGIMVYRMPG